MFLRRLALIAVACCVPIGATTHCNSSASRDSSALGNGGTNGTGAGEVTLPLGGGAGEGAAPNGSLDPLCGSFEDRDCNPDDPTDMESCRPMDVPSNPGSSSGGTGGSNTSMGGASSNGGGLSSWGGQAGQGGMAGAEAGAAGAAGEDAFGAGGIPADGGSGVSIPSAGDPLEPTG